MIPEREQNKVTSTITGEKVAMSIDSAAMAHIMGILTDIYSDPELAIIREYATNALDSHVAAGQRRPIVVTTPTALRPTLTIRDFGLGLDAADIRDIYSQYGASTKRGSNEVVGMLGIGCKSALAYAPSFTLTANKGGERIVVSVGRDAQGSGELSVLESGATDEPDGVEVSIPARRDNQLEDKARNFFRYWQPGTVLLNDDEPEPIEGVELSPDFLMIAPGVPAAGRYTRSVGANMVVVMGNVPYPVPLEWRHGCDALRRMPHGSTLVARVPIGTVQFAPSREALADHPSTRAALDGVMVNFQNALAAYIERHVAHAKTKPAAARALVDLKESLGDRLVQTANVTYHGEPMPTHISAPNPGEVFRVNAAQPSYSAARKVGNRPFNGQERVPLESAFHSIWVLDYKNEGWTKAQRDKLLAYAADKWGADRHEEIILWPGGTIPQGEWLGDDIQSVSWDTVKAWRDPNTPQNPGRGSARISGSYYAFMEPYRYFRDVPATDFAGLDVYYEVCNASSRCLHTRAMVELVKARPKSVAVLLPETRRKKFERDFPRAKRYRPELEAAAESWAKSKMSPKVRRQLSIVEANPRSTLPVRMTGADDPDLRELSELWDVPKAVAEVREEAARWRAVGALSDFHEEDSEGAKLIRKVRERYPLLNAVGRYGITGEATDHLLGYVNAVYAGKL